MSAAIGGAVLVALTGVIEHRRDRVSRVAVAAAVVFAISCLLALASPRRIDLATSSSLRCSPATSPGMAG
jgi:hypothetical protein